jgi:hypothetical protein
MATIRWLLAIPLVLAVWTAEAPARASAIRDEAGMFSPRAIEEARSRLDRLEQSTGVPVIIETIKSIPSLTKESSRDERERAINQLAKRRDQQIHDEGLYILISRREHVISETLIRERLARVLPIEKRETIRDAFVAGFAKGAKAQEFDGGLSQGVQAIEEALRGVKAANRNAHAPLAVAHGPGARRAGGGASTLWTFLMIGLAILAVLVVLRVLGGLFSRSQGGGYPNQMGGMGMPRPGMGPGGGPGSYGGPGYGGRGGGFFSGLLGGLGGAIAGNWLYDQMSGRHGNMTSAGAAYPPDDPSAGVPDQGGDEIIGAEDNGGRGASWDDGSGGDTGGGDWGGGDGGGDWGGGGGDWGGGDGGGDWGGGGDW